MDTRLQPGKVLKTANFDENLPPFHPTNKEAARVRGVRYDMNDRVYKNAEGRACYDATGRPL
jgi:hypothetical protein